MQTPFHASQVGSRRDWSRWPILAFQVLVVLLLLGDFVDTVLRGFAQDWHLPLAVLGLAAAITGLRFPLAGVALGIVPIASIILVPGQAFGLWPLVITTIAVVARSRRTAAIVVVGGYAAVVAADLALGTPLQRFLAYAAILVIAAGIGLGAREQRRRSRAAAARILSLEERVARVRADERAALAAELSDLLADDLDANRDLLARAETRADAGALARALAHTEAATQTALTRLRELVAALRGVEPGDPVDAADDLQSALDEFEDQLVGRGHPVELTLPDSLEGLSTRTAQLLQACLRTALDEARTAAVPGSTCTIEVTRSREETGLRLGFDVGPTTGPEAATTAGRSDPAAEIVAAGGTWHDRVESGRRWLQVTVPARSPAIGSVPVRAGWAVWLRPEVGRFALTAVSGAAMLHALVGMVTAAGAGDQAWPLHAGWAAVFLGIALAGWWPIPAAALLVLGALAALPLYQSLPYWQPAHLAVIVLTALTTARRPRSLPYLIVAWIVFLLVAHRGIPTVEAASALALPLFGAIGGLALHHFRAVRGAQVAELDRLRREEASVRDQERRQLAGELHDIVAHQLSLMSMQIMAHRSDDLAGLRRTAAQVSDLNRSAKADLATLVHLLRDGQARSPAATSDEAEWAAPSRLAEGVAASLTEAGHTVRLRVDPAADDCDPTTRRTIARILREATTNILRYAPPESDCGITIAVDAAAVDIEVTSPLGTDTPQDPHSTGWGLLGLTERAHLTGGRFRAGPDGGLWRVCASLPSRLPESVGPVTHRRQHVRVDDAQVDRPHQHLDPRGHAELPRDPGQVLLD